MKFTKLLLLTFALSSLAFASSSYAKNLRCERYQEMGTEFFTNYAAYESWFPKTLSLEPEDFEKIPGRKSIQKSRTQYAVNNPSSIKRRYVLFPSGKLTISSPTVSNASGRYKCNMTPDEVLAIASSNNSTSGSGDKYYDYYQCTNQKRANRCNDTDLCDSAVTTIYGSDGTRQRLWSNKSWAKIYVKEAKKRKLDCGVGLSSSQIIPETSQPPQSKNGPSSELKQYEDSRICSNATTFLNGTTNWFKDAQSQNWVNEAKRRGLSCGVKETNAVEAAATEPITIDATDKMTKAEEKCTSLGFTAGTEKHGDCVMKLLDY